MAFQKPRKRFSQNFLVDHNIAEAIVAQLDIRPDDAIFEIGTGRGILTELIARSEARLYSFEIDRDFIKELQARFSNHKNVEIINSDFLKVIPGNYHMGRFKLIGNIPYDITSPLLDWIIKWRELVSRAVITAQKELGDRISAGPGGKDWAPISIFAQCFFDIKTVMTIPPGAFYPKPKVFSSTLLFEPGKRHIIDDWTHFEQIVRQSFAQRRKLLINNLRRPPGPDKCDLEKILAKVGLDKMVRAEQVSIEDFIRLAKEIGTLT